MTRDGVIATFSRAAPSGVAPDEDNTARAQIEFCALELPLERVTDCIMVSLLVIPGMIR